MAVFQYQQGDRPLEGYTIEYALGRGGFGEVYYAKSDAGREVALKAIQNHEDTELRGIGHCMNLKSPHLVMIFDVKQGSDGTPWVIMEYVSGPSLREILDDAPAGLGEDKAVYFLAELGKGIQYLHDAGVVHRDLKPHNVFFEEGFVKVGDYSLSKAITHSHRSGHTTTVGSVHYMAPEISMGRYDRTVDVYALGVMFYEMLTGSPPYTGESIGEVLMKHLTAQPDMERIPQRFRESVSRALHKDPEERFQNVGEFVASVTRDESSVAPPASLSLIGKPDRKSANISAQSIADTIAPDHSVNDTGRNAPWNRPKPSVAAAERFEGNSDNRQTRSRGSNGSNGAAGWVARAILALIVMAMLMSVAAPFEYESGMGGFIGSNDRFYENTLPWMMPIGWIFAMISSLIASITMPVGKSGFRNGMIARAIPAGMGVLLLGISATIPTPVPGGVLMIIVLSLIVSQCVFDWRKLLDPRRPRRILFGRTLAIGAVAGIPSMIGDSAENPVLFSVAFAMAVAVTYQLTSSWYAPGDQSSFPRQMNDKNARFSSDESQLSGNQFSKPNSIGASDSQPLTREVIS